MTNTDELLMACKGIRSTPTNDKWARSQYVHYLMQDEEFAVPDNIYIKVTGTSTKGTIGKLVDIEFNTYADRTLSISWDMTYIIQCKDRSDTNRIRVGYATILKNYTGTTKYVRTTKKKVKAAIPPHVNKYNQELNTGDWIVGLGSGKQLYIGAVVKWTRTSVWVTPSPDKAKSSLTRCITHPYESFKLPQEVDYEQMVTMMLLQGWKPR